MRLKKILVIFVLVTVFEAFLVGMYFQRKNPDERAKKQEELENVAPIGVTVRVAQPHRRDMYEIIRTTGTLEPIEKADVYAKVPGEVLEVYASEGEQVEAGKVLVKVDDKELKLNVRRATVAYNQAKISFRSVSSTLERNKQLFEEELISEQQYEQVKAQYDVARSQVKSASVVLQEAKLNFSYTRVKAPMDGVITFRDCEKHQRITNAQRLFQIALLDTLQVKIRITENEIPALKNTDRPVKLRVEALKGTQYDSDFEGRLSFLSPVVDSSSGTAEARVEIPNDEGLLTSGMFTRVLIETRLHSDTLVIPKQALRGEEGSYYVFIVETDDTGTPRARRVNLQTGLADDLHIELPDNELTESNNVVIEGQNLLNEGDAVIFASPEEYEPEPANLP